MLSYQQLISGCAWLLGRIADHLWQSLLFCALGASLAYLARDNAAVVRLWLWRICSLKFLVPFSLLFALGRWLGFPLMHSADPLPARLKARERLPVRADALHALHRPRSLEEAEEGRRRLAFDELLLLQLGLARRAREREQEVAPALGEPGELLARYREALPFALTEHQERAIADIDRDLAHDIRKLERERS